MKKELTAAELAVFKASCSGKVPYRYASVAEYALDNFFRHDKKSADLEIYQCKFCKQWHVGHKIGSKKK